MVDDFGRIFFYNEHVYRAINPLNEEYCRQLIKSNFFKDLQDKGFIPKTTISDIQLEGYNLILEHEKLIEIQQHEWSFEMFKSSALLVLEINKICNNYGFELKDAHTFNILFRGVKPVWVDIGSISPIKDQSKWIAYDEFLSVFYVPIQFYLQNEIYIVRKLVESNFYLMQTAPFQQLWDSKLIEILKNKPFFYSLFFRNLKLFNTRNFNQNVNKFIHRFNKYYHSLLKKPAKLFLYEKKMKNIEEIENSIATAELNRINSEWHNYHKINYKINGNFIVPYRFKRLLELLNIYCNDATSAIDLAGNEGFFSNLLLENSKLGRIILTDYDANAIDNAYQFFVRKNDERISVALLNFMFTKELYETSVRFRSDIVIALAVTHHLFLTQNYSLETILERLKLFSRKYVIVEFMPLGLWSIHTKEGKQVPNWYNQEWFEKSFKRYFKILHVEKLEENRIVYLGSF